MSTRYKLQIAKWDHFDVYRGPFMILVMNYTWGVFYSIYDIYKNVP